MTVRPRLRAVVTAAFGLGGTGGVIIKTLRAFAHDAASDKALHHPQFAVVLLRHKTDGITHGICARSRDECRHPLDPSSTLTRGV